MESKKFTLEKKGYGKGYFYSVIECPKGKIKEKEREGMLFNSRKEAYDHAIKKKREE